MRRIAATSGTSALLICMLTGTALGQNALPSEVNYICFHDDELATDIVDSPCDTRIIFSQQVLLDEVLNQSVTSQWQEQVLALPPGEYIDATGWELIDHEFEVIGFPPGLLAPIDVAMVLSAWSEDPARQPGLETPGISAAFEDPRLSLSMTRDVEDLPESLSGTWTLNLDRVPSEEPSMDRVYGSATIAPPDDDSSSSWSGQVQGESWYVVPLDRLSLDLMYRGAGDYDGMSYHEFVTVSAVAQTGLKVVDVVAAECFKSFEPSPVDCPD